MKYCSKCDLWKDESMFTKSKDRDDGLNPWCGDCTRANSRMGYLKNIDKRKKQIKDYQNTPAGKKMMAESIKKYLKSNPKKYVGHWVVTFMKKQGLLNVEPCEVCGEKIVHAHHDNYDRPFEVRWLCPQHHKDRHAEMIDAVNLLRKANG